MILVTGGAGYVGSHFVRTYLARNPTAELVVLDNFSVGHKEALGSAERVTLFHKDYGDSDAVRDILSRFPIDRVVHFAASCYVEESQQDPSKYFKNNVSSTLSMLAALEEQGIRKFVFSSSCATYGHPVSWPIDELHPQEPINVYGMTKLMVEQALRSYAQAREWSYVALRYFNAAGADPGGELGESHDPETHIIPLVMQAALGKREVFEIRGNDYDTADGTCIRDYVHVNDLAVAHCQALELVENQSYRGAINLGTAFGASVLEVLDLCRQVTGKEIPTKICARRPGDPARLVASYDKAKAVLGWQPAYDLRQIVETAWHWEQNRSY
jgi:UDP-glucose 4-epimerase